MDFKGDTQGLHNVGSAVTVEELCVQFADAVKVTQGINLDSSQLQIATVKGRLFGRSHLVHKAFDSDADVYVSLKAGQHGEKREVKDSVDDAAHVLRITDPSSNSRSATEPRHVMGGAATTVLEDQKISPLIAPLLSQASQKEAAQHLRAAAFIYQQVHACLLCQSLHAQYHVMEARAMHRAQHQGRHIVCNCPRC